MNNQTKRASNESISDEQLWTYWQGEIDAATATEIETDPTLWARAKAVLETYQQTWQPLSPPAAVADAVSAEELGAYHLGVLPPERAREVEIYLKRNPGRAMELQMLENYLLELEDELPPAQAHVPVAEPNLASRAKVIIAKLVSPFAGTLIPAYALRGADDGPRTYVVGDLQIGLEVEDDLGAPGYKTIIGTVLGTEESEAGEWQVVLWQDDRARKVGQSVVDELGGFEIEAIPVGSYLLTLTAGETEIQIPELEVTE